MKQSTSVNDNRTIGSMRTRNSVFGRKVSDEALEAAVGDFQEVKCSQCGGTCNSSCSTSTR